MLFVSVECKLFTIFEHSSFLWVKILLGHHELVLGIPVRLFPMALLSQQALADAISAVAQAGGATQDLEGLEEVLLTTRNRIRTNGKAETFPLQHEPGTGHGHTDRNNSTG